MRRPVGFRHEADDGLVEYASVARILFGHADALGLERLDPTGQDEGLKGILDRLLDAAAPEIPAPECSVALDVIETVSHIEVVADLPGVQAADVTILFARNTLVIVGHKRHGA